MHPSLGKLGRKAYALRGPSEGAIFPSVVSWYVSGLQFQAWPGVASARCPRCGEDEADTTHLILLCEVTDRTGTEAETEGPVPDLNTLFQESNKAIGEVRELLAQNPHLRF